MKFTWVLLAGIFLIGCGKNSLTKVLKNPDPQDARGVVLSFTPEGEALCQRLMAVVEQRNQHIVACLTAGEQAQFDSLLTRLVEHARQTLHPPPER